MRCDRASSAGGPGVPADMGECRMDIKGLRQSQALPVGLAREHLRNSPQCAARRTAAYSRRPAPRPTRPSKSGDSMYARKVHGRRAGRDAARRLFSTWALPLAATPEEDLIAAGEQRGRGQARTVAGQCPRGVSEQLQQARVPLAQLGVRVQGGMVGVDLYANDAAGLQRSLAQLGARNVKIARPVGQRAGTRQRPRSAGGAAHAAVRDSSARQGPGRFAGRRGQPG